jgi:mono/diheme cytochrome c family protein
MACTDLADSDLVALLSFLRAQPPVKHSVPPHEVNLLGQAVQAFVLTPQGPTRPVRATVTPAVTAAYGEYLVHSVANCVGCHTARDMRTGAFTGPLLGGGAVHESLSSPGKRFVAPNLTPDARWGWIASWPEEVFVARFRQGRLIDGSPMPWPAFRNMSDDDLRAIFRYLRTVPAVAGGPDPSKTGAALLAQDGQTARPASPRPDPR